ncbi:hypothetical protein GCM10023161_04680 [Mycobacterium paraffinicum]|uniref:Uncharacterized protein n=1 Tax=Mycobacterium paraffinicum TaxID=53378 RepID=A0ABP8RB71_9MYCO
MLNWKVAVATWVPSGAFRWVTMLGPDGAATGPPSGVPVPDGAGEPVHTAGVVPSEDEACWGDEHAPSRATAVAAASADMVTAAVR